MDLLKDLWEFLWAVINSWAGYITGGVVVALLWLWSTLRQRTISRKIGIGVAVLFLFLALFSAWRTQYRSRLALEAKLSELTHPRFGADFNVAIAPAGKDGQSSVLTITGAVKNEGAPSVIYEFGVAVKLKDGTIVPGRILLMPAPETVVVLDTTRHGDPDNKPISLRGSNHWFTRSRSQPIPMGGACDGWLMAIVNTPEKELLSGGAKLILSLTDVHGRVWPIEKPLVGDGPGPPPSMWDIEQPR